MCPASFLVNPHKVFDFELDVLNIFAKYQQIVQLIVLLVFCNLRILCIDLQVILLDQIFSYEGNEKIFNQGHTRLFQIQGELVLYFLDLFLT